ncbi:YqiA/YcfP family alpha/beta fold hydrolase [Wenyingzhuangia sp. 1_MG-2023]|nr:YqiA/YcfP family alpha/beta fold hydrolase [Wenyingzhuangia sp. 1_MG-2023]
MKDRIKKLAIFSHGKESGPNGKKISILKKVAEKHGFETIALDYTKCKSATERVRLLEEYIQNNEMDSILLVGSSMGGYVSTVLSNSHHSLGLFLLCPALYMTDDEYSTQNYHPNCKHIEIIHGWDDEIVPFKNSIKFGQQSKAVVNLIDDNHRLKNSYAFMEKRFDQFLNTIND